MFFPAEGRRVRIGRPRPAFAGSERGLLFAQYSFHRLLPEHRTVRPLHCIHHIAGAAFLVPAFILLPLVLGVDGLWLAIPAAEMLTLMVILVVILVSSRQKIWRSGIKCLTLRPKTAETSGGILCSGWGGGSDGGGSGGVPLGGGGAGGGGKGGGGRKGSMAVVAVMD